MDSEFTPFASFGGGLSRLSIRSFVAVPVFMSTAAITVFVIRHIIGG